MSLGERDCVSQRLVLSEAHLSHGEHVMLDFVSVSTTEPFGLVMEAE